MTGLELLAVAYVVVGLGFAAYVYSIATGGWDDHKDRETAHTADLLRLTREAQPGPFAFIVGLAILVMVLAWPIPGTVLAVDEVRRLWDRRPCRCAECRAERKAGG